MYSKPHTLHTIRGSYCISSGSTSAQYDTRYELRECRLQTEILFTIREIFFYTPRFFTIRGLYYISSGCNRIVLQILMSQTHYAPIRTRYDLILTYGTGCILTLNSPPFRTLIVFPGLVHTAEKILDFSSRSTSAVTKSD
jgi:hypothetical protein